MSHPFGDLLHQHLHRKHGLTQAKLAEGILQDPAVISNMCHGRRLTGKQARERVVAIIGWLNAQEALSDRAEADALLNAAGLIGLQTDVAEETALLAKLSSTSEPAIETPGHSTARAETQTPSDQGPPSSLPQPTTPFVGRQRELAKLMDRLAQPGCRLLSLVGPGGIGKTRLGIRVGELVLERPDLAPDGVFFVALDGLEGPAWVVPAIAAALDFSFHERDHQEKQLLRHLKHKQLLLILDNAEGILDADLVLSILGTAPHLKLLVTTREALNVREEWFHPIAGMDLSDGDDPAVDSDAVEFFVRCAFRARPDFQPADEHACAQAICRAVGGVPLAIELAAAWLKALSCEQVAQEVSQSIDILTSSMHDMPERHRSLRAVLEQSWRHLSDEEQRVFLQLSIFRGGFRPEAAQAVADVSLPVLLGLVDKSVLQLAQDGRYRIHPLLRQMGEERLAADADEHASVAARHSAYYLRMIAHPARTYLNEGGSQHVERIKAEINNIFVAWYWAVDHGRIVDQRMAMEGLYWFSWLSAYHEECEKAFRYAVEILRDRQDDSDHRIAYAYALACHGTMGIWLGHDQVKNKDLLASVALLRQLPDARRELAYAVGGVGWRAHAISQVEEAKSFLYEAIELDQETEQFELLAWNYCLLGYTALKQNDYQEGEERYQQALRLGREIGDQRTITHTLHRLGRLALQHGEYHKARRYLDEGLVVARSGNLHAFVVDMLYDLGKLCEEIGELERALAYLQQGLEVARTWGKRIYIAHSLGGLAQICTAKGDYDSAADFYQEATNLLAQIDNTLPGEVKIWAGMGRLALFTCDYAAARIYYEKSAALARQSSEHLARVESLVGLSLAAIGQGDFVNARHHLAEALQEGLLIGFAPILLACVTSVAEYYAAIDKLADATELAALVKQHTKSTAETRFRANTVLERAMQALAAEDYAEATTRFVDSSPEKVASFLATELYNKH